jgi:hypothetical protein
MQKPSVTLVLEGTKYTLLPHGKALIEDSSPIPWTALEEHDRYRLLEAGLMRAKKPQSVDADYRAHIFQTLEDEKQADVYARLYQTLSLGQKKHVRARVTINGTRYRLHDDASVTINSKENVPWVILASSHRHTLVYECFMRAYSASQRTFGTQDSIPEELAGFIDNTVRDPDQHKIFEQICSSFE